MPNIPGRHQVANDPDSLHGGNCEGFVTREGSWCCAEASSSNGEVVTGGSRTGGRATAELRLAHREGENQPTITTIGRLATALRISASGLVAAAEEFLETPKQPRRATPPRRSAKALQSSLDRDASSHEPSGKSVTRIRKSAKGGLT